MATKQEQLAHFQQIYESLNDTQKKAVDSLEGPVMVIAGPGTGKTELLGIRAANLLKKTDVFAIMLE